MSKERDLLERVLLNRHCIPIQIIYDINDLLAQPETKQEPVAWMWEELEPHSGEWYGGCVDEDKPPENQYRRNIQPLYTSPPKREPLSDTKCPYPEETSCEYRDGFTDGILYAEKHHGIGVDNGTH
jgi:hypothetical protein